MKIMDFDLDMFSLEGKNALVTGGNTGLGQAFSTALAKGGANVMAVGLDDDGGETKEMIEACGSEYKFMQADITEDGRCKAAVDAVVDEWGSIDILVNCAGISINVKDVTKYTRKEWDKMISVNLTAAFELIHESAKYMIEQESGKVINIGSLFSFLGGQWSPAYASTKHGIVGLTKAMCDELAQFNVQVNTIAPGYFKTKITEETRKNEERNKTILSHIPANRWGDKADLMGACVYLASPASDYVNGTVLTVDGGYLVR
ncbi:SDR family oxidoreductase [Halanaerobium sp. Z-7514]|uniref:SDR family oxidoreductase n=1 Tax=Halanaerobium polyolivorans TaxID=2886943 RepID=A0AAW4X1G7_9FIRM|nr:SDR family oxidoreductase [Halanaerobium polyolivorans]MCC3145633.1 SDR family oxidoreductase [Halanaerobium polyolivorans]RQD73225.1 MAG: SDR family oxidoreductase [Halanaerobium sp. MSAO_Bac5]